MKLLIRNGRSLLHGLICIILLPRRKNHQKFEVTTAKEINKCKMFLHFSAFEYLIRRNQPEFLKSCLNLSHIIQERVLLTNFRQLSNGCF